MKIADAMLSTIGELDLRDEYALLPHTAVLSDVAKALSPVKNTTALIRGSKKKGISGIIKIQTLLKALEEGLDPEKTLAKNYMDTNLLRLRVDTPVEKAVVTITERNPDGVLVLNMEKEFVGYLSAEDFRSIQFKLVQSKPVLASQSIREAVELRDEYRLISSKSSLDKAALLLRRPSVQFVLVQKGKSGIQGVLSVQDLLRVFSAEKNPDKERVKNHMRTNLLRLKDSTPIFDAVRIIRDKKPDGVLILNEEGEFYGFLSPDDYRQLVGRVPAEIEHDGSFDSLAPYLRDQIGAKHEGPVVWTNMGSELVVMNNKISTVVKGQYLNVTVPVACDQTGIVDLTLSYSLGDNKELDRNASIQSELTEHTILQNLWEDIIIDHVWKHMLDWIDSSTKDDEYASGFAIAKDGSLMHNAAKINQRGVA